MKEGYMYKYTDPHREVDVVGIGGTLRESSTSRWALERALAAAEAEGATTTLIDLNQLDLQVFRPGTSEDDYGPGLRDYLETVRNADAVLISTGAYHGTVAGVTKNAIDYFELLSRDERPYLSDRPVGLIATAGGEIAAVNSINAMVHAVHALRGTVVPLVVPIHSARTAFDKEGNLTNRRVAAKLDMVGREVVKLATPTWVGQPVALVS